MTQVTLIAMSHAQGTLLTVGIIVAIVLIFGVVFFTDDMDWFD